MTHIERRRTVHFSGLVALALLSHFVFGEPKASGYEASEKYKIATRSIRNKDTVRIEGNAEQTYVNVLLSDGIGRTKISLVKGKWTERVSLRVHSKMLEKLAFENSKGDRVTGGFSHSLDAKSGQWKHRSNFKPPIKSKVVEIKNGKGAALYFEISVPSKMLGKDSKWLIVEWVDAYR